MFRYKPESNMSASAFRAEASCSCHKCERAEKKFHTVVITDAIFMASFIVMSVLVLVTLAALDLGLFIIFIILQVAALAVIRQNRTSIRMRDA